MLQRFSTANLAPAHRHDAWLNRGGAGIGQLVDTRPDGAFDMWSEHLALGPVGVNFGEMSAQHYDRPIQRARRDQVDGVAICLMLQGKMHGNTGDRGFLAGPGALTLLDLAQAARHHSTESRTVMITLPRETALAHFGPLHQLHGAVADSVSSGLLRKYLVGLHEEARHAQWDDGVGNALGGTVLNLLAATLAMARKTAGLSQAAREEALKLAAVDEIHRRLDWAGLDSDYLCARLKVSRTSLYRLFEAHGGVQAYIREVRLAHVYEVLSNPASADQISDLAVRMHFSHTSHLSRAFRKSYGLSPTALRRRVSRI